MYSIVHPGIDRLLLSRLFPAREAMLDHTILEQEMLSDDGSYYGGDVKKAHSRIDEARAA